MEIKNLYDILEVNPDCSLPGIKARYKKLASIYHPDNDETGDEEKFKDISIAYRTLKDSKLRAHYDNFGFIKDESSPTQINKEALTYLKNTVTTLIESDKNQSSPEIFLQKLVFVITQSIESVNKSIAGYPAQRVDWERFYKKIEGDNGLIDSIIEQRVRQVLLSENQESSSKAILVRAKELAQDYKARYNRLEYIGDSNEC